MKVFAVEYRTGSTFYAVGLVFSEDYDRDVFLIIPNVDGSCIIKFCDSASKNEQWKRIGEVEVTSEMLEMAQQLVGIKSEILSSCEPFLERAEVLNKKRIS